MRFLFSVLLLPAFFLVACSSFVGGEPPVTVPAPTLEPVLTFPPLLDLADTLVTLPDFESGWRRYATPGGQLSFLYPPSWQVDDGEWNITRTIFVGTPPDVAHPVDMLLTVHSADDLSVEDAIDQVRVNPLTSRMLQISTTLLDPSPAGGSGSTVALYRTTVDANRAFLHLIVPRRRSVLTIETPSTDLVTAYPLRVVLESVRFRD